MSDLVNIQKEFEELISQLEKLKKVNEITSANTESSKKVIDELDQFIRMAESYLDKSNQNHLETEKLISDTVNDLRNSIQKFENDSGKMQENLEMRLSQLSENIGKILNTRFQNISKEIEKIIDNEEKIAKNQAALGLNYKSNSEKIQTKISAIMKNFSNKISQQDDQIKFLRLLLYITIALMIFGFGGLLLIGLN